MPLPRFRIRTLMIAVAVVGAALAVLNEFNALPSEEQEIYSGLLPLMLLPALPFGVFLLLAAAFSGEEDRRSNWDKSEPWLPTDSPEP
ncbi:MAG: hypothetical protein P4L84_04115 [Isosphaeraceae bacterium]|nr:hypothetical protein [Isosphaeraceae bacterium]